MLTGDYAKRAKANKLPKEVRALVDGVRAYLAALDRVMVQPESFNRGKQIGQLSTALEMAVDRFELYGITERKAKR